MGGVGLPNVPDLPDLPPIPEIPKVPTVQPGAAPSIRTPGSKEIASLEVKGAVHTNWKNVRIEQQVTEWYPTFMFETTEYTPVPLQQAGLQFQPGDSVRVYIGHHQAVFGYITERHVAFDSKTHAIRLIGNGDTFDIPTSSVPLEVVEQTHDNKNVFQLAKDITAHLNIKIGVYGDVDMKTFDKIGIAPGETMAMVIEKYARQRNIVIGSMPTGGLLLIGENPVTSSGNLIEGDNILKANAVIRDVHKYKKILATQADTGGSSSSGGGFQSNSKYELEGTHTRNRHMVAVCEVADGPHGTMRRCHMERVFTEGTEIEANITVQGWFKDNNSSDSPWRAGEYYFINSPSLMLAGAVLGCAQCVYEQSDGGTTTTMKMVDPPHMNGLLNYRKAGIDFEREQRARATPTPVDPNSP